MEKTMIKMNILDYRKRPVPIEFTIDDTVTKVTMAVISGDEVLTVHHNDGEDEEFDSSNCRLIPFKDGEYDVYDPDEGINLFEDDDWMDRRDPYDYLWK